MTIVHVRHDATDGQPWFSPVDDWVRREWIATYFETLWTGREGYAFVARRRPRWAETAYWWPREASALIREVWYTSLTTDVYAAVLLRRSPNRRREQSGAVHGHYLWIDLDRALDEAGSQLLRQLAGEGSFGVATGSPGHRHIYLRLDQDAPGRVIEELNHRLAVALGGDSKWPQNSVLRPPGTFSHKRWPPRLVTWGPPW